MALQVVYTLNKDINQNKFSCFNEDILIQAILKQLEVKHKYCVDIGASDGISMSNTFSLFKSGWQGLAVEFDTEKFASLALVYAFAIKHPDINLCKIKVNPENINSILAANQVPTEFGFLNLDIDSYDYFVLEQLLKKYRPSIICAEINESIPPPIKFTVNWYAEHSYSGGVFSGQSISQLNILCERHEYEIADLEYNNAFLIAKEINPFTSLTPEEAYETGYIGRCDRLERFPWHKGAPIEEIHNLSTQDAIKFLNKLFSEYKGRYTLTI